MISSEAYITMEDLATVAIVDGKHLQSASRKTVDVINPSSGKKLAPIPEGCEADVNQAVSAARRAFADGRWRNAPPSVRKQTLRRLAELIVENGPSLDALDALEMGKPVGEALFNAVAAGELMRFYSEAVDKVMGDVFTSDAKSLVMQRLVPRGVVAAIVPWNFPVFCAVLKIAPALAAGNSVVLKPSELSTRSAVRLGQLALQAGLPPGVLNVVPGIGETVGQALALHMDVDLVTFTGSTAVGKQILQYAGQSNLKAVMAECGGKSPQIVFDDGVDLDAAAQSIAGFLLVNQGQICSVGSRLLVQRSIENALTERIVARMKQVSIGDAMDPKTTFGPLASAQQCARVVNYLQAADAEGAQLVTGGQRALRESGGYFVEPTLYRNVKPTARIAQEEIFGPVLSVIRFDNTAEAIEIANSTTYGLAAYVWTADLSRGMQLAKEIPASIWINAVAQSGEGAGTAASFEPMRQSGFGAEGGLAGMQSYMRRHSIQFNHA